MPPMSDTSRRGEEAEANMKDSDPSREFTVFIRGCIIAAMLAVIVATHFPGVGQALGLARGPAQSEKR